MTEHPFLSAADRPRTLPLGIHGDGGSFSKQDSLFVFTFNSLVGVGATSAKRFPLTIIKKTETVQEPLQTIMDIFSWSFNVALTGLTPDRDWAGKDVEGPRSYLAGRWRGALVQVRGDWEFYTTIFRFPTWNGAEEMCWMCKASAAGDLSFTSCGTNAKWRETRRTHESYVEDLASQGKELPVLLRKVRGLRLESVMVDVLHAVDLGVAAHIVGSIMWACVKKQVWPGGGTQDEQTACLNEELQQHCKDVKEPYRLQGPLTVARLRTGKGWPKLKSKGAACRHLARFAWGLADRHLGPREAALAQLLVRFYELISAPEMFFSAEQRGDIAAVGLRLAVLYSQLSRQAFDAGVKAFKMNPKLHLFQHLAEWQSVEAGSPTFYWTYPDEDMVGHMVECASSCHPKTLGVTAMFKWVTFAFSQ